MIPAFELMTSTPHIRDLLLEGKTVSLFLSLALLLLSLLGRRKEVAECGVGLFMVDNLGGRYDNLLHGWRLQLRLKSELELEVVKHHKLELLTNRG